MFASSAFATIQFATQAQVDQGTAVTALPLQLIYSMQDTLVQVDIDVTAQPLVLLYTLPDATITNIINIEVVATPLTLVFQMPRTRLYGDGVPEVGRRASGNMSAFRRMRGRR